MAACVLPPSPVLGLRRHSCVCSKSSGSDSQNPNCGSYSAPGQLPIRASSSGMAAPASRAVTSPHRQHSIEYSAEGLAFIERARLCLDAPEAGQEGGKGFCVTLQALHGLCPQSQASLMAGSEGSALWWEGHVSVIQLSCMFTHGVGVCLCVHRSGRV